MTASLKIILLLGLTALTCALRAQDEVAAATLTKVGQVAPDFTAPTLTGETITLSKLRGQVVVLSFFATWCGPCKAELPHVEKELWQEFRAKGLTVLAVDREEPAKVIAPFVRQLGLTFPIATDLDRKIYGRYATAYIPRTYVIAPDGTIAYQSAGNSPGEFAAIVKSVKAQLAKVAAK